MGGVFCQCSLSIDTGEKKMLENVNFDHVGTCILTSTQELKIVEGLGKTMLYIIPYDWSQMHRKSIRNQEKKNILHLDLLDRPHTGSVK